MSVYSQIDANRRNSLLLVLFFAAFVVLVGWLFGEITGFGYGGVALAAVLAVALTLSQYFYGDKMLLALSAAKPVSKREYPHLYNTVEGLALATGNPMPALYMIDDTAPNAFATGRDPAHASVVVTSGLVQKMNRSELEGVLAHEMSHVKNYDIRMMMLVAVLVGVVALLSDWLLRSFFWGFRGRKREVRGGGVIAALAIAGIVLAVLSPIIAQLIKFAVSRRREFLADADGALITKNPAALASALEKISKDKEPLEAANKATAHLYIVNPLKNFHGSIDSLFSTHPPIGERIRILRSM
jgi:heat shock protein HtpX